MWRKAWFGSFMSPQSTLKHKIYVSSEVSIHILFKSCGCGKSFGSSASWYVCVVVDKRCRRKARSSSEWIDILLEPIHHLRFSTHTFVSGLYSNNGEGLRSGRNRILVGNSCNKKFNKKRVFFLFSSGRKKWKWTEAEVNHRTKGSVIHDMTKIPQNFTGTRISETHFLHVVPGRIRDELKAFRDEHNTNGDDLHKRREL